MAKKLEFDIVADASQYEQTLEWLGKKSERFEKKLQAKLERQRKIVSRADSDREAREENAEKLANYKKQLKSIQEKEKAQKEFGLSKGKKQDENKANAKYQIAQLERQKDLFLDYDKEAAKLNELQQQWNELQASKQAYYGAESGSTSAESVAQNSEKTTESFQEQAQAVQETTKELSRYEQIKQRMEEARDRTAEFYKNNWSDYFKGEQDEQMFNNVFGDAEERLNSVRQRIAEIQTEIAYMNGQNPLTNQFIEAQDQAEALRERIYEIQRLMAENDAILNNPESMAGERLNATVSNLELKENLETAMAELQEIEEEIGRITEAYGDNLEPLQEQIDLLKEAKAEAEQLEGALGEEHQDVQADASTMRGAEISGRISAIIDEVKQEFRTFGGELAMIGRSALSTFGTMAHGAAQAGLSIAKGLVGALQRVGSVALNATRSGLKALWNGLQKIASMAASAARTVGGALVKGLRSIGSAALNAGKSLLGFNKKHRDFSSGLKHSFMTIVKYAFGVRSLYFLFRRLRSAIIDSVKTFAQHDAVTGAALNRLSAALNTMKASWGAAFAPILTAVAPLLNYLINLCTRAANAIAALFSALTGRKTYSIAVAGASDVTNANKNIGKSAKDATEELKEEKKQLAGFDELEILSDDKNKDKDNADDGSGGGGGGGGITYQDLPIPDWAQQIKDMIDNGQWEELADMLTDKLNELVDSVDWAGIGDKIGYWLNGALTFLARALTGFDWYNLASKLTEMLNHVMYGVDWENLGKILVAKLYIMLRSLAGFLRTFDWEYFTRSLYDVLRGAILGIDWVQVTSDFVDGISDMFGGIADGLDNINFGDFARAITTNLQRVAEEIDWDSLGASISHFLHAAITSATTFLQNLEPTVMANNIRQFFTGVFGQIDLHTLTEDFLGLISTMIDNAGSMLTSLGFGQMAKDLSKTIADIFSLVQWGELASSLSNFLHTVMMNALQFLKNLNTENIAQSFGTFIHNVFEGIDFQQLADDFFGILNEIIKIAINLLNNIETTTLGEDISNMLYKIFSSMSIPDLAGNVADLLCKVIETGTTFLMGLDGGTIGKGIENFFYNTLNKIDLGKLAKDVANFIIAFCDQGSALLSSIDTQGIGQYLWDYFATAVSKVDWAKLAESIFTFLGQGIGAAVNIVFSFIESAVNQLFDHLRSYVTDKNGDGKITGGEIIQGILEGIWETMKDIGGWIVDHIFTPFINGLKSAFGIHSPATTMNEPGQMIGEGLLDGIAEIFKSIGTWIKEHIFDPIVQGAKDGIQAIKETFGGIGDTVGEAINSGKEFVSNTWDNFIGIFKDKKPDVYPTEEAKEFKNASDDLNETLNEQAKSTVDAKGAYQQLSSTIAELKGKSNLTREEMELLLQSERMLTDLTNEYGNELERQGVIVDSNAQSVQNAANAVTEEANAVTNASMETQNLNSAVNDSNAVYGYASDSATRYGTNVEAASSKSENAASKVEASAEKIESAMTESTANTADAVLDTWNEIESGTISFSENIQNAISGVADVVRSFAYDLTSVLNECVISVTQACAEMAAAWNTDWGTPHFHMPIFSMSGNFDLQTGQTPQVIIAGWTWMARGGIVDGATLIGAGEDGKEAVIPLERHTEWIDMVADGLIERLSSNKFVNQLADAFMSVPIPAMANGSVVPPNAFQSGFDSGFGDSLMEELKVLRSEIANLAKQPIEVSSVMYMDRREVGRSVSEYQRGEARAKG